MVGKPKPPGVRGRLTVTSEKQREPTGGRQTKTTLELEMPDGHFWEATGSKPKLLWRGGCVTGTAGKQREAKKVTWDPFAKLLLG